MTNERKSGSVRRKTPDRGGGSRGEINWRQVVFGLWMTDVFKDH